MLVSYSAFVAFGFHVIRIFPDILSVVKYIVEVRCKRSAVSVANAEYEISISANLNRKSYVFPTAFPVL